ncbi:MAG: hypothetical protein WA547_04510 [Thermoplasmata archaeon]
MSAQRASETPSIANPFPDLPAASHREPTSRCHPRPRVGDYSRTRLESRVLFREQEEDADEIATETRRFSLLDITSGLPDDSREADERAQERRLRDLRARVSAARALVATTPGLAGTIQRDWRKAGRSYTKFGITEEIFRRGVPSHWVREE